MVKSMGINDKLPFFQTNLEHQDHNHSSHIDQQASVDPCKLSPASGEHLI